MKAIAILAYLCPIVHLSVTEQLYFRSSSTVERKWIVCPVLQVALPIKIATDIKKPYKKKYVTVLAIADNQLYQMFGRNEKQIFTIIRTVYKLANRFYAKTLNIRFSRITIEIWKEKDPVPVEGELDEFVEKFARYQYENLRALYSYTVVHLFVHERVIHEHGDIMGTVYKSGKICHPSEAVIVVPVRNDTAFGKGLITSHEFGHLLGFGHDGKDCTCKNERRHCIMVKQEDEDKRRPHQYARQFWSNCALEKYALQEEENALSCLVEKPEKRTGISFVSDQSVARGLKISKTTAVLLSFLVKALAF